tara:strand:- start:153 stop:2129 length:1977 start_codon:yes stop_codon:yes gene_type:complete
MAAIIEIKYFNTFTLYKTNNGSEMPIWNSSRGIPEDLGGYEVVPNTNDANNWVIEESRITGGYNNTSVDFGAKAYIVEEDTNASFLGNSLIYSGPFNSRTGINKTNVFSIGEDITKSADPANGSIQKLYASDSNLNVFQELKVSRALIDKDAIYSAEGGGSVTSSNLVIGVLQPFAGEYGISKNPESFAQYGYNQYFSDKNNNAILELNRSGINEISSYGMKNFFRTSLDFIDNSISEGYVVGGFDIHNKQYVTSLQGNPTLNFSNNNYYTLAYDSKYNGWVSFYDYEPDQMFSLRNEFYSVKTLGLGVGSGVTTGCQGGCGPQTVFQLLAGSITGNIEPGATIRGCLATPCVSPYTILGVVASFDSTTSILTSVLPITLTNDTKLSFGSSAGLYKHYSNNVDRSNFYGVGHSSSISFVVNDNPVKSKSFLAISYEGSSGWNLDLNAGMTSDPTGDDFSIVTQGWAETQDRSGGIPSYYEGRYTIVESQATSAAASATTSVVIKNLTGTYGAGADNQVLLPVGSAVSGNGVVLGTVVVSYTQATGVLVLNQDLNIAINTMLYFNAVVDGSNYLAVFGSSNPGFINQLYKGFNRKENKYVASLINNSRVNEGEVNFGEQIAGIKGFYVNATMSTDTTTNPGGEKQLFQVSTTYTQNNGY